MRRKFALYTLALFVAVSFTALAQTAARPAAPPPAPAGPPPTKVGIINIEQAILASNEGQREVLAMQKRFEPKQNEIQTLGKEVEDNKKQLNIQGNTMNDEARAALVKNIEQKQKNLQRTVEDANADFEAQKNELISRMLGKIMPVMDKYAKENGFALIINYSGPFQPIAWTSQSAEVTQRVIDAYNVQSGVAPPPAPAPAAARPGAGTGATGAAGRRPATPPPTTTKPN